MSRRSASFGLLIATLLSVAPATAQTLPSVSIAWDNVKRASGAVATLQVVVNPLLRRGSPIHDRAFAELKSLGADFVRFVPWMPYPRLAVAELEPPGAGGTSWDFSLIDPPVLDFLEATAGHPAVLDFSTIPAWMFRAPKPVPYPADPDQVTWDYGQGTDLADPSAAALAGYQARIVAWYAAGGFTDEAGRFHTSGHHYAIPWWEVLNEPEGEHATTVQQYTQRYDAIVAAVRRVSPSTRFVGLSLGLPMEHPEWFEYFLDPRNHRPGMPLDMIAFHFYAIPGESEDLAAWQHTFFAQADGFLRVVRYIAAIRDRLSPATAIAVNETGSLLPRDILDLSQPQPPKPIPDGYWPLSGALFAYLYGELARLGVAVVGESQLVGFPGQFPSVSMLDWRTGAPNARFQVLRLLHETIAPTDAIVPATVIGTLGPQWSDVAAQGFRARNGMRKLLLINKRDRAITVALPADAKGAMARSANAPDIRSEWLAAAEIVLAPFEVAVLILP